MKEFLDNLVSMWAKMLGAQERCKVQWDTLKQTLFSLLFIWWCRTGTINRVAVKGGRVTRCGVTRCADVSWDSVFIEGSSNL